jgi:hypothetical protein
MLNNFRIGKALYVLIGSILFVTGCNNTTHTYSSNGDEPLGVNANGSGDIYYNDLFGDTGANQQYGIFSNSKIDV